MSRESGILLPLFSLPSKEPIGTMGEEAYQFVDFLSAAGQKYWQVLPLGPTSYGDSPYQSYSSFAGNPYFIDLYSLVDLGYLQEADLKPLSFSPHVDYPTLWIKKFSILRKAFSSSWSLEKENAARLVAQFSEIQDYALFMALKKHFSYLPRNAWPEARFKKNLSPSLESKLQPEVDFYLFIQLLFYRQWNALKQYAHQKNVNIIGDLPIYVADDSADLWANPQFFLLDKNENIKAVAGVPPDYFSQTGQRWGNPLYNWNALQKDNFQWWARRMQGSLELYDMLRIDHFRGFESFWQIPSKEDTAINGKWVKAKGKELFSILEKQLGNFSAIVEDLGIITPPVKKLIQQTGFPGMKVLLFAFYANQESDYLPHRYEDSNCVVYTGTHDNETVVEWMHKAQEEDLAFACSYLNLKNPSPQEFAWAYVQAAWQSKARIAIAPLQDILALGAQARINTPSTLGNNWQWRLSAIPSLKIAQKLAELTRKSNR